MTEYRCPKCGGELERGSLAGGFDAYDCDPCCAYWPERYLEGYWTRDREEQEKRCENCRNAGDFDDGGETECRLGIVELRDAQSVKHDFRCKFWEPRP